MLPNQENRANGARRRIPKWLKITLWSVGGFIVFIVLALTAATLYLSSGHLAKIVSKSASEYFYADVDISKMDFTLWKTFPHLELEIDSMQVVSRTLHTPGVTKQMRDSLPDGSDSLLSLTKLRGSVNVMGLLRKRIELSDVEVSGLHVNLVVLNDSVNNFSIVPSDPDTRVKIPYISANKVMVNDIRGISYYGAPNRLVAKADLRNASLERVGKHKDEYRLSLGGDIDAAFRDFKLVEDLPFEFAGRLGVAFNPFRLSLRDMDFSLANISSKMSLDMDFGKTTSIDRFSSSISPFGLMQLLGYIPSRIMPSLAGLHSDMTASMNIRLTKPYSLSSGDLPSFEARFEIPPSTLYYRLADGTEYRLDNINMVATFLFNGDQYASSYCTIDRLQAVGEGINLLLTGRLSDIFSDPQFAANIKLSAELPRVAQILSPLGDYGISGSARVDAGMAFPLALLTSGDYKDIALSGDALLTGLGFSLPDGISGKADRGKMAFAIGSGERGKAAVTLNGAVVKIGSTGVLSAGKCKVVASEVDGGYRSTRLGSSMPRARFVMADGTEITATDLKVERPAGGTWRVDAGSIATTLALSHKDKIRVTADSASLMVDALNNLNLKVRHMGARSHIFPAGADVTNLDAGWLGGDSLALRSLALRSQESALRLTGSLKRGKKLSINAYIDADTLHLNQIAHTFQSGSAKVAKADKGEQEGKPHRAFLTPADVELKVKARAKATVYTNLWLEDLGAELTMKPGVLALDTFYLSANFGHAAMAMRYDCPDSLNLRLGFDAAIRDFNLTKFFQSYPNVLAMMPQMKNLHGIFTASAAGHTEIFPTMDLLIPSIYADIDVTGRDLYVHQNNFIRHLARMLLIFRKGDIYIPDIHAKARVFDELLQVYPFDLSIGKYRLTMMGRNDFSGALDYHVGVKHTPLIPLKFGINIGGMFHDPKMTFGGEKWDVDKSARIDHVNNNDTVNVIDRLQRMGILLLHHAAESDTIPGAHGR